MASAPCSLVLVLAMKLSEQGNKALEIRYSRKVEDDIDEVQFILTELHEEISGL